MERVKEIWIEKALNSLDGIQPTVSPAGLHNRIMQRLDAEKFSIAHDVVRPVAIYRMAAAIAVIVAVNVFTCVAFQKSVSQKKGLSSFAKEYSMTEADNSFINM